MLITLKTLQQQTFKVEIDPSETVLKLKEKIAEDKGAEYAIENQKLIYAGKILDDAKVVSEYKIEEKNFVVIMVTKPKPKVADTKQETSTPVTTVTPSAVTATPESKPKQETEGSTTVEKMDVSPTAKSESATPAAVTTSVTTPVVTTPGVVVPGVAPVPGAGTVAEAESLLVTGETFEQAVQEIMTMGFERDQVLRAMSASFNNPDRAVDYLLNGIPEDAHPPAAVRHAPAPGAPVVPPSPATGGSAASPAPVAGAGAPVGMPAGGVTGGLTSPPPGSAAGQDPLAFLRTQPQFVQMRQVVQQNPNLLPTILQQIRQSNPRLLQIITENQDRFVQMLNEPVLGADIVVPGAGGGPGPQEPEPGYIQVTPEEKQAIDRLKALGFPEGLCLQAYFACEKNEDLAANFLLSQEFEDDDDVPPS